ncbi:hypothetical protein [Thermoleptolyngbya sp. C42_A2020_037]|nr:hypothetical protein [Thermoleptolyngbya sp. C42_A2020_037]MBF2085346.1 hypothetical protein [Thermoleptolyngbya sp. C42_A2020_037]
MENQNPPFAQPATLIEPSGDRPKSLKTNPFTTYRDPQTGRWIVVKPTG